MENAGLGNEMCIRDRLMTPQTVNAYYNPTTNEICFPAAIPQPPFFDMNADDAMNYGATVSYTHLDVYKRQVVKNRLDNLSFAFDVSAPEDATIQLSLIHILL